MEKRNDKAFTNRRKGETNSRAATKVKAKRTAQYLIAMIVIPLILFFLLEGFLIVVQYGYPTTFFIKKKCEGQYRYVPNHKIGWRYFPKPVAPRLHFPGHFPARKGDTTYRIFVFGESAVQGDVLGNFSFTSMLDEMLKTHYPGMHFEVINTGMVAISSWTVLQFVKEMVTYQPDLFIIYCGNNEIVGPYGPGTIFASLGSRTFVKLHVWASSLKITQLLTSVRENIQQGLFKKKPVLWKGMEMFLEKQIPVDDDSLPVAIGNFRQNIKEMVGIARNHGVPVIVCTVASNVKDSPPFSSMHRADLSDLELRRWESLYQHGVSLERQGLFSQALEIYQRAEQIDAAYAELNFRMADGYYRLGNYTKAKEYYIKARDNDTLRFRPSSALYQVIKQDYGIQSIDSSTQLVDIERSFAEASPEGIPGENLFYDHVHLNIDGHYLVASRIFDSIVHNGWLSNVSTTGTILGGTCSKTECLKRLGYTTTDEYKLLNKIIQVLSRPPFTNQLNHETHLRHLKLQYENYLQGRNKDSMEKTVADYKEALLLNRHNEGLRLRLASTYKQMGQYEEARDHYLKLLEMNPGKPQILHLLAKVYSTLGKSEKAIECYQEAIKHRPYNPVWYSDRGLVYFKKGDYDKAIADFSQALSIEPKYAIACNNRGSVYFKKGDYDKAIADFNRAVSIDPNYAAAYNNRGSVYFKKEDYDKAWEDFHQAQRLGHPVDPAVLKNRGRSP
jgi:tetratricopeptide (TPR) repeat protein